jgi:hypothetical protein
MKLGEEQTQQIILFDWIRHAGLDDICFHIPNERRCSPQHGAILKRMGVKAGVSDVAIMRPSRGFHGMFLELKSSKGKISPLQSKFMADMHREGYATKVAYGSEEAIFIIKHYLILS